MNDPQMQRPIPNDTDRSIISRYQIDVYTNILSQLAPSLFIVLNSLQFARPLNDPFTVQTIFVFDPEQSMK